MKIVIVTPILDDWDSLRVLAPQIDARLSEAGHTGTLLAVNDGSTREPGVNPDLPKRALNCKILDLKRNLGHQRAIVAGLVHVAASIEADAIIVMDGDGEDRAEDVIRLIEAHEKDPKTIIFAKRTQRSEGTIFRLGYQFYKLTHRLLTGRTVTGGNFSLIPQAALSQLLHCGEIWQHYAAGILTSRLPMKGIDTQRGKRISGQSQMNLIGLVVHGLSAIAVFDRIAFVRLLILCGTGMLISSSGILATVSVRLFSDAAIPGWATYTTGLLGVLFLQLSIMALILIGMLVQSRLSLPVLPVRDVPPFIDAERDWTS